MISFENKKILVIGAHADDEVLGVGGTILKAKCLGASVDVLIVTDSVSAQYKDSDGMYERRSTNLEKSCISLGVDGFTQLEFPDMRLDTVAHIDLNMALEIHLNKKDYDIIFIHHEHDINKDHRVLFESLMVASRPVPSQSIRTILSYFTPSSTEWGGYTASRIFTPNVFIDISSFLEKKISSVMLYEDELRGYPHPRSKENIMSVAKFFGSQVGLDAAEAFCLIRNIIK